MPRFSPNHVPGYRHHKSSGQAIVTIAGRDHYLGAYDSPASHEKYNQLVAAWFAAGRNAATLQAKQAAAAIPDGPTINEVIAAFWTHAQAYYTTTATPAESCTTTDTRCGPCVRCSAIPQRKSSAQKT